jgi:hypothetical protein
MDASRTVRSSCHVRNFSEPGPLSRPLTELPSPQLYLEPGPGIDSTLPAGVDYPGIGHVKSTESGPRLVGEVPQPLAAQLDFEDARERAMIRLLFAARDLANRAMQRVRQPHGIGEFLAATLAVLPIFFRCTECGRTGSAVELVRHRKRCNVGRVQHALEQLSKTGVRDIATAQLSKPAVGDGHLCQDCGRRDTAWLVEERPANEIDLGLLRRNQSASVETSNGKRTLYTHLCPGIISSAAASQGGAA